MPTCVVPGEVIPRSFQNSSQALSSCWKLICRFILNPLFFWGRALILIVLECILIFLSEKLSFGDSGTKATICNQHSVATVLTLVKQSE